LIMIDSHKDFTDQVAVVLKRSRAASHHRLMAARQAPLHCTSALSQPWRSVAICGYTT
jgi:hypothetical protein